MAKRPRYKQLYEAEVAKHQELLIRRAYMNKIINDLNREYGHTEITVSKVEPSAEKPKKD